MKTEKFLRLVKENPDVPIIPMVDSAVVADKDYGLWLGSFGDCRIDSYVSLKYYGEERFLQDTAMKIFSKSILKNKSLMN